MTEAAAPQLSTLKDTAAAAVDDHRRELVTLNRWLYEHPEIGHQEFEAARRLTTILDGAGYDVSTGEAGMETAFRATLGGGGPRVAILAEYDALPGLGHGCGHNLIAAMSTGAALALAAMSEDLEGTVVAFGTPAEEGAVDDAGGKARMVDAGLFRDIDAAMMIHPSSVTSIMNYSNAREAREVTFHGRSAHAAGCPEEGINALDAAILTFNNWNALRQQMPDDVKIHGIITDGGTAPNVIPDRSQIRFYVRAASREQLTAAVGQVMDCVEAASAAAGTEMEVRQTAATYENMVPARPLAYAFRDNLERLDVDVDASNVHGAGSTDMGNVSHVVPSIHPYISMGRADVVGHTEAFREATVAAGGERALFQGAKVLAMTALDVLHDDNLRRELGRYHRSRVQR